MKIKLGDLYDAYLYAGGEEMGMYARLHKPSGRIYRYSEQDPQLGDPVPEDIDSEDYLAIPNQHRLHLGVHLVFEFVEENMPEEYATVQRFFKKSGAYRNFRNFLERQGRVDEWHAYRQTAEENALREWAEENGIEVE